MRALKKMVEYQVFYKEIIYDNINMMIITIYITSEHEPTLPWWITKGFASHFLFIFTTFHHSAAHHKGPKYSLISRYQTALHRHCHLHKYLCQGHSDLLNLGLLLSVKRVEFLLSHFKDNWRLCWAWGELSGARVVLA